MIGLPADERSPPIIGQPANTTRPPV